MLTGLPPRVEGAQLLLALDLQPQAEFVIMSLFGDCVKMLNA